MLIWNVLICIFFLSQALALMTAHMDQLCGGTIPRQDRYRRVSFRSDSSNITHRNCKVRVTAGILKLRDGSLGLTDKGFLIVFEEVNLFNLDCGTASISITEGIWNSEYVTQPDPSIAGIPRPLCSGNIPWSVYPTPVIKAEDTDDLDIWFRAAPDTPDGAGFKLLIVDYYDGSFQCQEGEFRCNNKRCVTKAVENSECDGIDWCMDNTGCDVNVGLIVGLCVAFGAVLFVLCIVICIVCCAKHKSSQYSRGTDRYWGTSNPTAARYRRRESPPAPYVPRESMGTALRYPSTLAPNQAQRGPTSSREPAQRMPRPEPSPGREPPSYNSIWEPSGGTNDTSSSITAPQSGASFSLEIQQQPSVPASDTDESYQPPPPDYEIAVEYPELYKVTERDPTFV